MIASWYLFGLGASSLAAGSVRPADSLLHPLGFALIAAALVIVATPALADEHVQAVDNGEVACTLSSRELTRVALVGDAFASVSKITSGSPLEDFTVTNEPIRGDIYLSVPASFAGQRISFFATSKQGFVYKFACGLGGPDATQVFVTNPGIALARPSPGQVERTPREAATALIQAMAVSAVADGYRVTQPAAAAVRVGALSVRLIANYEGATLAGKALRIDNRGTARAIVRAADIAPGGTLAVSIADPELESGEATTAYVVGLKGQGTW